MNLVSYERLRLGTWFVAIFWDAVQVADSKLPDQVRNMQRVCTWIHQGRAGLWGFGKPSIDGKEPIKSFVEIAASAIVGNCLTRKFGQKAVDTISGDKLITDYIFCS